MEYLYNKLKVYSEKAYYPFHMPGHKRQLSLIGDIYNIDISEIKGFDDLHHANGLLLHSQERASLLFGSDQTFFSVNGSSAAIMAAIYACTRRGERILMSRNSHLSAYHCIELLKLEADYLIPEIMEYGINGSVTAGMVREMLEKDQNYSMIYITSPTYDGVVSDISGIVKVAHKYDIPLVVDEAHGAHLGFSDYFPASALEVGADVVVQSIHKTLPSMTQSACLHLCGGRVDAEAIKRGLKIFISSSPSYVLMASLDACVKYLAENKDEIFEKFVCRLENFYRNVKGLDNLRVIGKIDGIYERDLSKIIISSHILNGRYLMNALRERYYIEPEMSAPAYTLCLSSVCDTDLGFERLTGALFEIDKDNDIEKSVTSPVKKTFIKDISAKMTISEAMSAKAEHIFLEEAEGRISADYLYMYPPGTPIMVPGEEFLKGHIKYILDNEEMEIRGLSDKNTVRVVKF